MNTTNYLVFEGLFYEGELPKKEHIVGCGLGDQVASANGYVYIENLVKDLDRKIITLDENFKITKSRAYRRK